MYKITPIIKESFRLDGGAMFGSIPKTLWDRKTVSDKYNRIQLVSRSLVIENAQHKLVIDLGCGRKWREKEQEIFKIEYLGEPNFEDLTGIILTHLHFDHCGGISTLDNKGIPHLTYPNVPIFLGENNLARAINPGIRERASYLKENVVPIKDSSGLNLLSDNQELFEGIIAYEFFGHTKGMMGYLIETNIGPLFYLADLIPTTAHVQIPYVMGYDLNAELSMFEKSKILDLAFTNKWWLFFEHDPIYMMGKVSKDDKGNYNLVDLV